MNRTVGLTKRFVVLLLIILVCFNFDSYANTTSTSSALEESEILEKNIAAQEKAWEIINEYADPDYFLIDPWLMNENENEYSAYPVTEEEYNIIQSGTLKIISGCETQREKIIAIHEYVRDNIIYDVGYIFRKHPYTMWCEKRGACGGIAHLTRTMLISVGIPCMLISNDGHAYNVAYDSDNNRWIFVDSTIGVFDKDSAYLGSLTIWDIYELDGLLYDGVYYSLNTRVDNNCNWYDMDWEVYTTGVVNKKATTYHIAGELKNVPLKRIGENTFYECTNLTSITIPNGVEIIGAAAFASCKSLKKVSVPNSVVELGHSVFASSGLEKIDLSNTNIVSMGTYSFYECEKLTDATLPNTLIELGEESFGFCEELEKLDLSNTKLKHIEHQFLWCFKLESVKLPPTLTVIGEGLFDGVGEINSIDLSNTKVTTIERDAFNGCSYLTSIKFTTVGDWAFQYCGALKELDFSNTKLTTVGDRAFKDCYNLEKIKFPSTLTTIGEGMCWQCKKLKIIDLSSTKVKDIPDYAFVDCNSANIIKLPNSITTIGKCAFIASMDDNYTIVLSKFSENELRDMGYKIEGEEPWYPSFAGRYLCAVKKMYSITYDTNGGKELEDNVRYAGANMKMRTHPIPKRTGYKFTGWYTSASGGNKVYSTTKATRNVILYAHWVKVHTVTFNANGGTVGVEKKWVTNGDKMNFMPTPKRTGYTFKGWYTAKTGGTKVYTSTKITKSRTLYARWSKNKYTVKFNANGGKVSTTSRKVYYGAKVGTLPTPKRTGYTFKGWYTSKTGGSKVSKSKVIKKNTVIYARWTKK